MDTITSVINWTTGHLGEVLQIVGAFAVVATFTKNKSDDRIIQWILDAVNFVGGNIGKAKNDPANK